MTRKDKGVLPITEKRTTMALELKHQHERGSLPVIRTAGSKLPFRWFCLSQTLAGFCKSNRPLPMSTMSISFLPVAQFFGHQVLCWFKEKGSQLMSRVRTARSSASKSQYNDSVVFKQAWSHDKHQTSGVKFSHWPQKCVTGMLPAYIILRSPSAMEGLTVTRERVGLLIMSRRHQLSFLTYRQSLLGTGGKWQSSLGRNIKAVLITAE